MEIGIGLLDQGLGYVQSGLTWVRELLTSVAGWLPINSDLAVTIVFLVASLWAGQFIIKKLVTRPFSVGYIPYTLIVSISIFLNLMYL